jgi:hypothetical protein
MRIRIRSYSSAVAAGVLLGALAAPALAATDAQKCESAVELGASKYAQCRLKAESKFTKTGDAAGLASDLASCAGKLATAYGNALARWSASCPVVEPLSSFEAYLMQCTDEVAAAAAGSGFPDCGDGAANAAGEHCDGSDLAGASCASLGYPAGGTLGCDPGCSFDTSGCLGQVFPATGQTTCWNSSGTVIPCAGTGHDGELQPGAALAYLDNGDGTITDTNTQLTWEKLSDDGSIHDKDTIYSWANAFAVKIAALNSASFAGHNDWRVPTVKELHSLLDYDILFPNPMVHPIFHSACVPACTVLTCSCTVASSHWSSTTYPSTPTEALSVGFSSGLVSVASKSSLSLRIRAVRGGS